MKQTIVGFHQDEDGHWVADLSCGHGYHMRHDPPWLVREWVANEEGRKRFVGHILECPKCDQAVKGGPGSGLTSEHRK